MTKYQQDNAAADSSAEQRTTKPAHTFYSLRLVKQRDSTGCGIACVAMLADVRYHEAKKALKATMGWQNRRQYFYTRTAELKKLLSYYDIDSTVKKASGWQDIKGTAIVGVDRDGSGIFHWVVVIRDKGRFLMLDPRAGEVFNGPAVIERDDSYDHSDYPCNYVSVNRRFANIKI